jgi:hypothetical protein
MRNSVRLGLFTVAVALSAAACGTGGTNGEDTPDASSSNPDAAGGGDDLAPPPAGQGFQLKSPEITLQPGEESTYCWYTTVPLAAEAGVTKWESKMTPGSHHLIVYFTGTAQNTDNALTKSCNPLNGGGAIDPPVWTYSAQTIEQYAQMPQGIGMTVKAQQKAFIQMHYLNITDKVVKAHVVVNGWTFAAGTSYIPAAAFITYNTQIHIDANVAGQAPKEADASGACAVPAGVNFFAMSTHSHRRSMHTQVTDGAATMVFESINWEHPGAKTWDATPFYAFKDKLNYACHYKNDLDQVVTEGPSAQTNEMCMAVGYFFCPAGGGCSPATKPVFCLNSTVIPN